ncbi:PREDICTED: zinc finger protein ZFP69-like [Dinoponera quadriceps]|uniref:Zinc finger protein ZFP69-like n=1 Tax=Dinoponera quadriceps TaxID=609295 RepID=A0A6P3X713_DINQU|nr:PREDICTED: zinc finger protein ZFP69-like [Dinoponera quadriceps]
MEAVTNQRNDARIEEEEKNEDKNEAEMEANKENTVPIVKNSKNSKRIGKNRSRQRRVKKREKDTPLKEQVENIVTTDALDQKEQSSDASNIAAVSPICKSQVISVKQENIHSEETSSQSRKSVGTASKSDESLVRIPIENSQSSDSSAYQETEVEALCVVITGDEVESKVNGKSDSILTQTTDINSNGVSFMKTDGEAETAVTLPSQEDPLVSKKSDEEARTSVQNKASCVSKKNRSERRSSNKISELMTEEQKRLIESSYRINSSLMKCDLKNKMTVLGKEKIKCNICEMNYSRPDKCKVHIMAHLEIKPYECVKCNYTTVTVSNIRAHIRKSHLKLKPYVCDQCDKRFGSMVLLQEHVYSHTGERPFKCEICGLSYTSRQGLNYHCKTHKTNKDIKCDICPKMFKSPARKRAHMHIHNKENMIQCTICKSYLSNQTSVDIHMKKVHSQKYVCDICNKEMLSKKDLYNHKNVHMKAKYKCTICFKYYKSRHILNEHILKHEGIRKYRCNDCGKTFAQQSHLAAHSATHSKIRFPCIGCEKQFNRRDNMKAHTKRCQLFLQKSDTFVLGIHDKLSNVRTEHNATR